MHPGEQLPSRVTWQQRPFPDANLLLFQGAHPAFVDSGFVGHAEDTAAWLRAHTDDLALVVNTHWHSDHVGGNALLQSAGACIAASAPDADAIPTRSAAGTYSDDPAGVRHPPTLVPALICTATAVDHASRSSYRESQFYSAREMPRLGSIQQLQTAPGRLGAYFRRGCPGAVGSGGDPRLGR